MKTINSISIYDFLEGQINYSVQGENKSLVTNIGAITDSNNGTFSWLNPIRPDKEVLVEKTNAGFIVIGSDEVFVPKENQMFIRVSNPKLFYVKTISKFLSSKSPSGIHPSSIVSPLAKIHSSVNIGPFCIIGECEIGEGSIIDSHCKIGDNTKISKRVKIGTGVVIGGDGYGYVDEEDGSKLRFPHIGGVIVCDDVEIGSNTCIDKGTLSNTVINQGVKIDNLVHIAHNVVIGKNSMIIANVVIGGSTLIGENSWIAPSATLRDGISIGSGSTVGLAALVTKSIPSNEIWAGFPAKFMRDK
jgi:UDP-3-O-[3-hydroxymyristoyl] glucosamine N-acyltransferase